MFLNGREISLSKRPYIIAELSANHNGSLDIAKETIRSAKECGADAIKIQTYCADSMTIDCDNDDFLIKKVYGEGIIYTIFIKKREHHMNMEII